MVYNDGYDSFGNTETFCVSIQSPIYKKQEKIRRTPTFHGLEENLICQRLN